MKRKFGKIWNWIKLKKYYFLSFFTILFILWIFCLPKRLFSDPTSTILFDKQGNLLSAQIADDGQWRFPHNQLVPEKFKKAIIQFEDRNFHNHIGISFKAIGRALWQNISEGRVVSGASTITMQVIRMSRKKPRNLWQKAIEMFMATRLEASYSKQEILALYASNAPMGGNVVGLDAAAWRYYGKSPYELTWAETALLAVLPNAPSLIHLNKNRDLLLKKRNRLLKRLLSIGDIDQFSYDLALEEPIPRGPKDLPQLANHLLIKATIEENKGKRINSTIDKFLQEHVLRTLNIHHLKLRQNEIYNAAAIVCNIETGEILSYVGNTGVEEKEHGGDVDIINSPRSSGSILKPFLYQWALENKEMSPKQLLPDIPITLSGYSPINYNQDYDGAIPADQALSHSLNIPFVLLLREYGVPKFWEKLKEVGMTTLDKSANHYGLSLILGGAETKLFDLINMYTNLANSVKNKSNYFRPHYINAEKQKSFTSFDPGCGWFTLNAMKKVKRPLDQSNWETYSSSREIAWKTGTSYGFKDAWAIGFDNEYIVGVWVGNADGEGRPGIIGIEAAAPILFDIFNGLPFAPFFQKPVDDIVSSSVCSNSGYRASIYCTNKVKIEIPLKSSEAKLCPYHQKIHLNEKKTNRVNSSCYQIAKMVDTNWFVLPPKMETFYKKKNPLYKTLPMISNKCFGNLSDNYLDIIYPKNESEITIPIDLNGKQQKIILEATHKNDNITLYWHFNSTYLGKTKSIHQIEITPKVGIHSLSVVDSFGESVEISFEVVN